MENPFSTITAFVKKTDPNATISENTQRGTMTITPSNLIPSALANKLMMASGLSIQKTSQNTKTVTVTLKQLPGSQQCKSPDAPKTPIYLDPKGSIEIQAIEKFLSNEVQTQADSSTFEKTFEPSSISPNALAYIDRCLEKLRKKYPTIQLNPLAKTVFLVTGLPQTPEVKEGLLQAIHSEPNRPNEIQVSFEFLSTQWSIVFAFEDDLNSKIESFIGNTLYTREKELPTVKTFEATCKKIVNQMDNHFYAKAVSEELTSMKAMISALGSLGFTESIQFIAKTLISKFRQEELRQALTELLINNNLAYASILEALEKAAQLYSKRAEELTKSQNTQ